MLNKADLIDKLFKSECTERELHQLMELMKNEEVGDKKTAVFERLWQEMDRTATLGEIASEDIHGRVISKMKNADTTIDHNTKLKVQIGSERGGMTRMSALTIISVAASVLLMIGAISWIWMDDFYVTDKVEVATSDHPRAITLPDQSIVELAPYSVLSYNRTWSATMDREVALVGEAFFEVKKYPTTGQKFRVVTSDLTAEVLGTSFSVNTLNNETEVFLKEGKVNLDLKEEKVDMLMQAGDVITYSIQTKERSKEHISANKSIIWKKGMTTMKNIALSEILQNIEQMYDVKFQVENETAMDRVFTIGIPIDNFKTTLSVLKEVMKLNVIQNGDQYIIQ